MLWILKRTRDGSFEHPKQMFKLVVTFLCHFCVYLDLCTNEPVHEISNNLVCVTSKASDQPGHTRILIRAFACCSNIL